jgi:hypothetical protein
LNTSIPRLEWNAPYPSSKRSSRSFQGVFSSLGIRSKERQLAARHGHNAKSQPFPILPVRLDSARPLARAPSRPNKLETRRLLGLTHHGEAVSARLSVIGQKRRASLIMPSAVRQS